MSQSNLENPGVTLGLYTISACPNRIYIRHHKSNKMIFISREDFTISEIVNFNDYMNEKYHNDCQADSIIGIFNYDENTKYLVYVTSSKLAAKFKGAYIYNITSVNLFKINFAEEKKEEKMRINEIKNFLSSKNFYYSIDYDISKSLYNQDNGIDNDNYLMNTLLLTDFIQFNIPKCFYCYVIFGFVGCKIDIEIDLENNSSIQNNKKIDLILIERTLREYTSFKEDISRQLREIEFLSEYKSPQNDNVTFSTVTYLCNEIFYQNINSVFNPYHPIIKKELDNCQKLVCVINDIYLEENTPLTDFIVKSDELKNKVLLVNQVKSDWQPGLYFESNKNCIDFIESYFQNMKSKQNVFTWFVDVNNNMVDKQFMNEKCLKAIIRIFWIAIQKQLNYLNWNINIGLFNEENNANISLKFKDIIFPYFKDISRKQILYKKELRNSAQKAYDFCFNGIDNNSNDNTKSILSRKNSTRSSQINKEINSQKLNILCITWNVDDLPVENNNLNLNLKDMFTENTLYYDKILPDIIIISLQRLVKINKYDEKTLNILHKQRFTSWVNLIGNNIRNFYSNSVYIPFKNVDFISNCFISFIKYELQSKIYFNGLNIVRNGIEPGNKGDKGFSYVTFSYNKSLISFASAYFNSNKNNNNYRLQHLKELLNTKINSGSENGIAFKESNFWIILGGFNFRIELDYEPVMALIEKKDYTFLANNDQLLKSKSLDSDFGLISEGNIMFSPTYKFNKGTNDYTLNQVKNKIPSYTDRIIYSNNKGIENPYYNSINNINYSSHKPVIGCFAIACEELEK